MVGIGTVLADNPSLTTRLENVQGKNPVRIVVDSFARTPLNSKLLLDGQAENIIVVTKNAPPEKVQRLKDLGAEIIFAGEDKVDLKFLLERLAEREITSVLVEGGGTLHFSLLEKNLVDKIFAFIAPKILGGKNSLTAVEGAGFAELKNAAKLKNLTAEKIGEDILICGDVLNDF